MSMNEGIQGSGAHSPGPWRVVATGHTAPGYDVCDRIISDKWTDRTASDGLSDADAALVAAAPDLLAALKEIVSALNTARMIMDSKEARDLAGEMVAKGRAAISKAEGRV